MDNVCNCMCTFVMADLDYTNNDYNMIVHYIMIAPL